MRVARTGQRRAGRTTVGSQVGPGAQARFTSGAASSTGALTMASLSGLFATGTDDTGAPGGTGGDTFVITVSGLMPSGVSTRRYTTLSNIGAVASTFAGPATVNDTGRIVHRRGTLLPGRPDGRDLHGHHHHAAGRCSPGHGPTIG